MKKVISIVAVLIFAIAFSVKAQTKVEFKDIMISSVKLTEGTNTVPVPDAQGSLKFTKRGASIINVIYTDATGKSVRLQPNNDTSNGAPKPACKCPLPDACFGTGDKNIGMCICKPCDLTNGNEVYSIRARLMPIGTPVK